MYYADVLAGAVFRIIDAKPWLIYRLDGETERP